MKKIPMLFKQEYGKSGKVIGEVMPGCEWVLDGEGWATEKVDGAACAIIDGALYRRYDANVRKGRKPPVEGIPCQPEPDPVSGHWPFWVECIRGIPSDQYFFRAFDNSPWNREDGTYEAVGVHFQNNPYELDDDFLEKHGRIRLPDCPRDYYGLERFLSAHDIEGVVFWRGNGEMCKIRRKDFGLKWPVRREDV